MAAVAVASMAVAAAGASQIFLQLPAEPGFLREEKSYAGKQAETQRIPMDGAF